MRQFYPTEDEKSNHQLMISISLIFERSLDFALFFIYIDTRTSCCVLILPDYFYHFNQLYIFTLGTAAETGSCAF